MQNLVLCSSCHRHFRVRDAVCPFCGANAALAVAPRPVPPVGPGASRARRYAVSAAFLAGSTLFACGGESSNDDGSANTAGTGGGQTQGTTGGASSGGSKSGQGGASGEQGGDGGASAGAGALGSATGGATQSSGGSTQSTGGVSPTGGATTTGAAGAVATGRACEGYQDRDGCRTADSCSGSPGEISAVQCVLERPPRGCGNPSFLPRCPEEGCGDGRVCVEQTCGSQCVVACTESSCAAGTECVEGRCQPMSCGETQIPCPEGHQCDFSATGPGDHCVAERCDTGDYECEPWQECAPRAGVDVHGCTPLECADDADCGACGYCVNQRCAPQLGICYQMIAMPYGCVWPDEELF